MCIRDSYNIVSKANNLYLQTVDRTQNASNIQVGYNNKSDNIKFRFDPWYVVEFGPFEIETKLDSNRVLDIDCGSYTDGANVQIWQPVNTNQERLSLIHIWQMAYIWMLKMHYIKMEIKFKQLHQMEILHNYFNLWM